VPPCSADDTVTNANTVHLAVTNADAGSRPVTNTNTVHLAVTNADA